MRGPRSSNFKQLRGRREEDIDLDLLFSRIDDVRRHGMVAGQQEGRG